MNLLKQVYAMPGIILFIFMIVYAKHIVYGGPGLDAELVNKIVGLAGPYIGDRIFFVERTHVIEKYYKSADIFVLPSLREGMPNALLEAMSCGLPVIVSRIEGVTDWVVTNGRNGLLVEPGNGDDLGKAMKRILNDDALAESLGKEAKKTVLDRFSIKTVARQYIELYGELILC